ncbi:ADP-ribosyl cyclase/cyclic ADP-ribose hydrolase 1 [Fundulus heteroclitus]|uniref:ADP-ribosyl cyclase/cyclic ADP-ribose hydrolase 1 n=1 Tax=Fundulus heteroclitus TaxID=8078 RepID=UPI00165BC526|nr:ADP-ribosyl cyclase/cyclic ADP-ribose hydrolase 1 [Fundulus heteroclitus]
MASGKVRGSEKRRSSITAVPVLIISIILGVTLIWNKDEFKQTFIQRCQKFSGYNCQTIWDVFQQAFVNRDPCEVLPKAYDPLFLLVPLKAPCNTLMFWSGANYVAHNFTKKNHCFKTMEDFMLGSVLNDQKWCGKKGSNETYNTGCPNGTACDKYPVDFFWRRSSAAFGDAACGNVTVMLNGSYSSPFRETSVFATVELKRFEFPRVKHLTAVLVIQENSDTDCSNDSLKKLEKELRDKGIGYRCSAVTQSHLEKCASDPDKPCGACWSQ